MDTSISLVEQYDECKQILPLMQGEGRGRDHDLSCNLVSFVFMNVCAHNTKVEDGATP